MVTSRNTVTSFMVGLPVISLPGVKSKSAKAGVSRASASVMVAFAHTHIYTPTEGLNFSYCHLIRCSKKEHEGHACHLNKWEVFPSFPHVFMRNKALL